MKYRGYNIILAERNILHDYLGMNWFFAKSVGFPWHWSKSTILIRDILKGKEKRKVIRHEISEIMKMKKGEKYWPAHLFSLKEEKKIR